MRLPSQITTPRPETGLAPSPIEVSTHLDAPVCVHPLRPEDEDAWNQFVERHPDGSFFHYIGWKKVMERTYGYKPYYFYSSRGGRISGIAPAFLVSSWISGRCLLSLPFAVYGGICADDHESEEALRRELESLGRSLRVDYIELRNRRGITPSGYHSNLRYSTFTMPLLEDADALYKAFPKDIRYMIRKGEKAGLRCVRGVDQLDVFYRLMTINLRRLGTPAFPRALFQNLVSQFPGQVDITLLYSGERPVAGGMSFFFRHSMQPYYIGSTDDAKTMAANNLLWWELIKIGIQSGCRIFDFGRSKQESGNYAFKKKWNPQIETLQYQIRLVKRKDVPNFSPTNPKFTLAMSMWKKAPLGLTRLFGPRLVRWFP